MEKEKEVKTEKGLMKLTKKELVGIILRKDATEVELHKHIEEAELTLKDAKESLRRYEDNIRNERKICTKEINDLNEQIDTYQDVIKGKDKLITELKGLVTASIVVAAALLIMLICL